MDRLLTAEVAESRRGRGERGSSSPRVLCVLCVLCGEAFVSGCRQDMHDQPKLKPQARSEFFADRRAGRSLVPGTVARGHLKEDTVLHTGRVGTAFVEALPIPVSRAALVRGQERYRIFCAPCHGDVGRGDGMVVRRGYRRPASFHEERLRGQPVGYFFDVITNGFGAMPDYAALVGVEDRWAIVAYVRALQLSQHAGLEDVPAERRSELTGGGRP